MMDIVGVNPIIAHQVLDYTSASKDALALAERKLKIAEAQVASELEYELCREHFPPEVMRSKDDQNWKCPKCENHKYTGMGIG